MHGHSVQHFFPANDLRVQAHDEHFLLYYCYLDGAWIVSSMEQWIWAGILQRQRQAVTEDGERGEMKRNNGLSGIDHGRLYAMSFHRFRQRRCLVFKWI